MSLTADVVHRALGRVGTTLREKWRLEEVLGVGGMATVYAATHRNKNGSPSKMLHTELSIDENVRARFLAGYLANTVGHPGAVIVLDDDVSEDGSAFLVMELLEGETLEMRTERKGKLPAGEVLALTDQLLDILAAAHEKGIVHRDIKPENLFFTVEGRLKVLDFGIAHLREQSTMNVTGTGSFMGTPAFMSPEHARGRWKEVDAQSDLWAVGATMFTMLSGRGVHLAETVNDQLILAATAHAPSIGSVVPELHEAVVSLVDRALAFDKPNRWPTARAMQNVLRKTAAELPSSRRNQLHTSEEPSITSSGKPVGLSPDLFGEVSQRGTLLSKRGETLSSSATALTNEPPNHHNQSRRSRPAVLMAVGAAAVLTVMGMLGLVRIVAQTPAGNLGAIAAPSGEICQPGPRLPPPPSRAPCPKWRPPRDRTFRPSRTMSRSKGTPLVAAPGPVLLRVAGLRPCRPLGLGLRPRSRFIPGAERGPSFRDD